MGVQACAGASCIQTAECVQWWAGAENKTRLQATAAMQSSRQARQQLSGQPGSCHLEAQVAAQLNNWSLNRRTNKK